MDSYEKNKLKDAQAMADLKFTYVVSCPVYSYLKKSRFTRDRICYTNILNLMLTTYPRSIVGAPAFATLQANSLGMRGSVGKLPYCSHPYPTLVATSLGTILVAASRVVVPTSSDNAKGKGKKVPTSLDKAKGKGKNMPYQSNIEDKNEIYHIKLPGPPTEISEGKPEIQNHAIIFTHGKSLQIIDMNQDNYYEEAFKMRNVLEEFQQVHSGQQKPTILGIKEHIFTQSVSSFGWFMSNQETSFVIIGQQILANPLRVAFHYGHSNIFDRIFHITRGGISKASKIINLKNAICYLVDPNFLLIVLNIHGVQFKSTLWIYVGPNFLLIVHNILRDQFNFTSRIYHSS
ncbi:Callose synthase 7, partial [Mucuna pruriens]